MKAEDAARLTRIIFAETTTLGVRRRQEHASSAGAEVGRPWERVGATCV